MTRVEVLTPAGSGAIATISLAGPAAWPITRTLFRPATGRLPDSIPLHRTWFGRFGTPPGDEVVVAVVGPDEVEVHCHGGRQVVRWVVAECGRAGAVEDDLRRTDPWALLEHAPTLRTANILLDQCHGAFATAVETLTPESLAALVAFAPVGRHLIDPWKVVVAGPPNVGKSSLVNALAGYTRAVVSPVAGTTRDAVTTAVAFDGWPVELTDTAGLRDAADPLEAEGVSRGKRLQASADLIVWVTDATDPQSPPPDTAIPADRLLVVANKTDLAPDTLGVSAQTGAGVSALATRIAARLVSSTPPPGAAVPYTPALADVVVAAATAAATGGVAAARDILLTRPVDAPTEAG